MWRSDKPRSDAVTDLTQGNNSHPCASLAALPLPAAQYSSARLALRPR